MKIENLISGLEILRKYSKHFDMSVIASSFSNGAPNHSHRCYLDVDIDDFAVSPEEAKQLKELGWFSEQEGQFWLFYN